LRSPFDPSYGCATLMVYVSAAVRVPGSNTSAQYAPLDDTVPVTVPPCCTDASDVAEQINATRYNPAYLPGTLLPPGVRATPDAGEALRGATTARANDAKAIFDATAELLRVLTELNGLRPDDIGYVWFTVTPDLDAAFPADAARAAADPQSDMRGSAEYKRQLVGALVKRATEAALQRARGQQVEVSHIYA